MRVVTVRRLSCFGGIDFIIRAIAAEGFFAAPFKDFCSLRSARHDMEPTVDDLLETQLGLCLARYDRLAQSDTPLRDGRAHFGASHWRAVGRRSLAHLSLFVPS